MYCKSAGLAKPCGDCAFNRLNWPPGQAQGREVKPQIRADKRCGTWQPRAAK